MCNMRDWNIERLDHYMTQQNMNMGPVSTRWLRVAMHRWNRISAADRLPYAAKAKADREYSLRGNERSVFSHWTLLTVAYIEIIADPDMFAQTQESMCKRLIKSLEELAGQMHHAGANLYWVTLRPDGKSSQLMVRGGVDVAADFAGRYCPFITMKNYALKERIPINVPGSTYSPGQSLKSKLDVLLIVDPTVKQARAQITSIMHKALTKGGVIQESDRVPWSTLEDRLCRANKRIDGWPTLSRGYSDYNSYTKEDGKAVMAARYNIVVREILMVGPAETPSYLDDLDIDS